MDLRRLLVKLSAKVRSGEMTYEEAERELATRVSMSVQHAAPGRKAPGIPMSLFSAIQRIRRNPMEIDLGPLKKRLKAKIEATRRGIPPRATSS